MERLRVEEMVGTRSSFSIHEEAIKGSRLSTRLSIEEGKVKEAGNQIFKNVANSDPERENFPFLFFT